MEDLKLQLVNVPGGSHYTNLFEIMRNVIMFLSCRGTNKETPYENHFIMSEIDRATSMTDYYGCKTLANEMKLLVSRIPSRF